MNKKRLIAFFVLLLCAVLVVTVVILCGQREKTVTVGSVLPICAITEKVHSDNYYLSIQLDSCFQEENKLPSDIVLIKCTKSVFEKVSVGNDYIGAGIEIVLPTDYPQVDVGALIRENKIDYFTITSVTNSINKKIS